MAEPKQKMSPPAGEPPLGLLAALLCLALLAGLAALVLIALLLGEDGSNSAGAFVFVLVAFVVPAVLVTGLRKRHPLARRVTVFVAGLVGYALAIGYFIGVVPPVPGIGYVFLGAVVIYSSLRSDAVWRYFSHACPSCKTIYRWPASLSHTRFRCKPCGATWSWKDRDVDASIFD